MGFMAALPYIATGLGGLGGLLSGRSKTQYPKQNPAYAPMEGALAQLLRDRLYSQTPLEGYEATGLGQINNVYDLVRQRNQNNLTRRGLSTSPIAANVDVTSEASRGSEIAAFQNQLPLLQRSLQDQDIGNMSDFLAGTRGVQTSGNMAGGALGGVGSMLGFLIGQGAFDKKKK